MRSHLDHTGHAAKQPTATWPWPLAMVALLHTRLAPHPCDTPCACAQALEIAAKPLGTSANFRPQQGGSRLLPRAPPRPAKSRGSPEPAPEPNGPLRRHGTTCPLPRLPTLAMPSRADACGPLGSQRGRQRAPGVHRAGRCGAQEQTGIPPRTRRRRQIARQFSSELRCNVAHRRQHRHPAVLRFCLPPSPEILHVAVRCEPGRVPEPHGILDPELILEGPQRRGRVQRPIAPSAACEAVLAGEREQATTPCTKGKTL